MVKSWVEIQTESEQCDFFTGNSKSSKIHIYLIFGAIALDALCSATCLLLRAFGVSSLWFAENKVEWVIHFSCVFSSPCEN
jgi:hypothetical protein